MGEVSSIIGPAREPSPPPNGDGSQLSIFEQEVVGTLVAKKLQGIGPAKLTLLSDPVIARLSKLLLGSVPEGRSAQHRALLAYKQMLAKNKKDKGNDQKHTPSASEKTKTQGNTLPALNLTPTASPASSTPSSPPRKVASAPTSRPASPTGLPEKKTPQATQLPRKHKANVVSLSPRDEVPLFVPAQAAELRTLHERSAKRVLTPLIASGTGGAAGAGGGATCPERAFADPRKLKILAFNTLKLRLQHDGIKDEVWMDAIEEFAEHDVLVLSEIPASTTPGKPKRAHLLLERLHALKDGEQWEVFTSEPSGSGPQDRNKEVHAVFAKRPVHIKSAITHTEIGGLPMGHAPFTCVLSVPTRFHTVDTFAITSVHLAPNSTAKRPQRDKEAQKLFKFYDDVVRAKLDLPFTIQGANDSRTKPVGHILCGDFNASAKELEELGATEEKGWRIGFGHQVDTSSGKRAYDNFVFNREVVFVKFALGFEVLTPKVMQNSRRGQIGISDHAAVVMSLQEV